ncbi:MAG: sialate O-acetylesterase [Firmicutes bacterium]|nr:sialate O-acetylesterase [Bacillota bacterium]
MQLKEKTLISALGRYISTSRPGTFPLRLPFLISDGMVIQREAPVKIWGWAAAGAGVTVNFLGQTYQTTAGRDGRWLITLAPAPAGGPYDLRIQSEKTTLTVKDILIGDVWICSGQSNMALTMARVNVHGRYEEEIATSENPAIRQFVVPQHVDFNYPCEDLQPDPQSGAWETANPESVLQFSATAYFFARALYEKYQVPIGLINASVGGTPIEAWLSKEVLQAFPAHLAAARKFKSNRYRRRIEKKEKKAHERWHHQLNRRDQGLNGNILWYDPGFDASDWPTMEIPSYWDEAGLGPVNGVVWFRKEIEIPASMTGKPAKLLLGRIVDSDTAYVNGQVVGTVSYQYPPRRYDLPENLLRPGKNVIVVRVVSLRARGGFIKDKPYRLIAGEEAIDLQGPWRYKVGAVAQPLPDLTYFHYKPLGLFNGMISPLINYTIKGVIWYQGESSAGRALEYSRMFPALITDWRQKWSQGDFPFLYVQLANYMEAKPEPSESNWAELREAQRKALAVPNTGMAVAIDLGEWNDLHPLNKGDVGKRLALLAQKVAYGERDLVAFGPLYQGMAIEGNKIRLTFTEIGSGLAVKGGGELRHFAIAGADKKFVWAQARIEGDQVIVWNDQITHPKVVRYAWADNPENANLYNREGLPASPFQAD